MEFRRPLCDSTMCRWICGSCWRFRKDSSTHGTASERSRGMLQASDPASTSAAPPATHTSASRTIRLVPVRYAGAVAHGGISYGRIGKLRDRRAGRGAHAGRVSGQRPLTGGTVMDVFRRLDETWPNSELCQAPAKLSAPDDDLVRDGLCTAESASLTRLEEPKLVGVVADQHVLGLLIVVEHHLVRLAPDADCL